MIYTKSIFQKPSASDGIRISVMSRHTLNDGATPDARITPESYDRWYQELSPPGELIGAYIKKRISWGQYKRQYIIYLRNSNVSLNVKTLAKEGIEEVITLLCAEKSADKCHRRLLAEECLRYYPNLNIQHR